MRGVIDYRPERDMYFIYLGDDHVSVYIDLGDGGTRKMKVHKPGDDRPPYLSLPREEYRALVEAILLAESPRLAEAALLKDVVDDTREVRDRLLTMLEAS